MKIENGVSMFKDPPAAVTGIRGAKPLRDYTAPFEVAVAAVLPCFWVYWRVGNDIHRRAAADNPFQAWIDAYVDEAYGAAVKEVIAVADRIAETASPSVLDRMHAVFRRSAQLEWMFWDAAYRLEGWPIG